jgi:hypothetical protein
LYFVNDNQIRYSAIETALYIPVDIHFVQFTWNNDRVSSTKSISKIRILSFQSKLYYEYNTISSNEQVLLRPVLNIIEKGIVPRDISSRKMMNLK